MRKIVVIKGPTSGGKTSLGIKLCQKFDGVIVSADSRQIYQQMDVGTGKLPLNLDTKVEIITENNERIWTINGIKIYGYDLVNPNEMYSAYDFGEYFTKKLTQISKEKLVFLIGGTGFFIDVALGKTQVAQVEPNQELRKQISDKTTEELALLLKEINPQKYENIDLKNRNRLIRAIEISNHLKLKDPALVENEKESKKAQANEKLSTLHIGLTTTRETLYKNTDVWLETIWKNGLIEETQRLMDLFPKSDKLNGLVYKSVCASLTGKLNESDAQTQARFDLHHYIKRQLTWFRKDTQINWYDISDPNFHTQIVKKIQEYV